MSQTKHSLYKELVPLEKTYRYYKRVGRGGTRKDIFDQRMVFHKYEFLKKKLEYLTEAKYENYQERIMFNSVSWGMSDAEEELLKNKMNNDTELITLNRAVRILKIQLLQYGYIRSRL